MPADTIGVLFVCLGNICRSPTAEVLFRHKVIERDLDRHFHIDSCGTAPFNVGKPPDPRAQRAAAARGHDLSGRVARQIRPDDYADFQHILVMDHVNLLNVRAWAPADYSGQIELLLPYGSRDGHTEIPDPYKEGDDAFDTVIQALDRACDGLLAHLRETYRL